MTRALLLSVGSEILRGETIDTNAAHLGGELTRLGFAVGGVRALPDDRATIAAAVREALAGAEIVLITGGLGPTHDDLTREALADALDEPLREDPRLIAALHARFGGADRMAATNARQALIIPSADVLLNPIGSAPGWWVERDGRAVATMPGVPSEMRRMFAEQILPRLARRFGAQPAAARVIKTFGIGESTIAERLRDVLEGSSAYEAGIYARDDGVHVRLASRQHPDAVEAAARRALELAGPDAYGTDDESLAGVVLRALAGHGVDSVGSFETGTGGALLAILSAADTADGARYAGGLLAVGDGATPVPAVTAIAADVTLACRLFEQDGHGRSRVRVELRGAVSIPETEVRVHGSGPQRLRRAAFAALDTVRRALAAR